MKTLKFAMSESALGRTPERRVLGDLGNTKTEPISPTANLRLLTSLASDLKSAAEDASRARTVSKSAGTPIPNDGESLKLLPRKQKSLGILCDKFLSLYPLINNGEGPREISLDATAHSLGTEKRRIYDIINVLESLEMATKAGKNRYLWHGHKGLVPTLVKLKSLAIKLGLREQIQEIQRTNGAYTGEDCDDSPNIGGSAESFYACDDIEEDSPVGDAGAVKEDKSLGAMCQKFVMLFLVSLKNGVINLDIAAKVLISDADNRTSVDANVGSRFKTKVRRLYDIANVLTAIGLIKKVYMYDRMIRKPVFKYVGPDVEHADFDRDRDTPMREDFCALLGMLTPSKTSRRLVSDIRTGSLEASTPFTEKRKPRKRKLFVGYDSKNPEAKSRSLERLDDSILRVAEMELEKLNSSAEERTTTPKVCTKIFARYNSDSCIERATNHRGDLELPVTEGDETKRSRISKNAPFIALSKENFVNAEPPVAATIRSDLSIVKTPVRKGENTDCRRILPTTSNSVNETRTRIVPRKLIALKSCAGNSSAVGSGIRVTRYKIQGPAVAKSPKIINLAANFGTITTPKSQPKMINLARLDATKLVPIKRSDLKISLAPVSPIIVDNRNNGSPGFAILTRIPAPSLVSPGDTFKAVKIGNTLRLVPIAKDGQGTSSSPSVCSDGRKNPS